MTHKALVLAFALLPALPAAAQLDPTCTVSALNRTVTADERGVWVLPNVPAGAGPVRLRATCVAADGTVRSGQSDFVAVPANGILEVPEIRFGAVVPVPARLTLSAPGGVVLTSAGQSVDLEAEVAFSGGGTAEVAGDPGTSWSVSNPRIATVSLAGRVTAVSSGTVLISALHEGALGVLRLQVALAGDSDGDGIPDDVEIANGLDPNDPVDGAEDPDGDLLATSDELNLGTDPFDPDTDGDTLLDGDEVNVRGTDPLLADTDGDLFRDGLEVATASDPLDRASFNLAAALAELAVIPGEVTIVFNSVATEASRTVEVRGRLTDDTELDLLEPRFGTTFASSNLSVANFGVEAGQIFAGLAGTATVTASAGGRSAETRVRVETFEPRALASLVLTGAANGVAVSGTTVYVAAGGAGLHVVDASVPTAPRQITTLRLVGSAFDVQVAGNVAWVAAGDGGLQAIDITNPASPSFLGSISLAGPARDLAVAANQVYAVDPAELTVIDVSDPSLPVALGYLSLPGPLRGVAVDGARVVVSAGAAGVHVVDVSDPAVPVLVETIPTRAEGRSSADDLAMREGFAYVADGALEVGGLAVVDTILADTPILAGRSSDEFGLKDVAIEGAFALAADYLYLNAVPIFNVAGPAPGFAGLLTFPGDLQGQAIAVQEGYVFVVASRSWQSFENWGSCVLQIGQYARAEDPAPVPPQVRLLPLTGTEPVRERRRLTLQARATDDFGVESVSFEVNGVVVGTDFESPWSLEVTVPRATELRAQAIAQDYGGLQTVSNELVVPILPDVFPAVRLLEPTVGSEPLVGGAEYRYSVDASDDVRVLRVEVLLDGAPLATLNRRPFSGRLRVPPAATSVTLEVIAVDDLSQSTSEVVSFAVTPNPVPRVAIVDPAPGSELVAGSRRRVLVGVVDDSPAAIVRLRLDGVEVASQAAPPWELVLDVPTVGTEIQLEATAEDRFGQLGSSPDAVYPLVDDPGTTVVGSVETIFGDPVGGAEVVCEGVAGVTAVDGSFNIPNVPTLAERIDCEASGEGAGGRSAEVPPVPAGETSVGPITITTTACVVGRFEWEGVCFPEGPVTQPLPLFTVDPATGATVSLGNVTPAIDGSFCLDLRFGRSYFIESVYPLCPDFENGAVCEAGVELFDPQARGLCGEVGATCADLGTIVMGCFARPVH
ncbi:MAG: Ig-like domain-containing protein [Thermoanaerobaculia bacterium]|nr:Ig-like domain-containing protein [Thermoanaerobaculia bacterium]